MITKKLAVAFLSATLLSSSAMADEKTVVATYSGVEVTEKQVMDQFAQALEAQPENKGKKFSELEKQLQEILVKSYINAKLLEKEIEATGIRKSEEFQTKLKNVESQMAQQEMIEGIIKKSVTDKMVDDEYATLEKTFQGQEEVKTSHILVDTEEKAKEIKKRIGKGVKFADLVKEFSKDESSKANGGELGYTLKGQLVPEYEAKAFSMKKGEVSDPVKTQFGYHIIKLVEKRPAQVPTKEQATQSIRTKLSREAVEKYINDLGAKANIELKLAK